MGLYQGYLRFEHNQEGLACVRASRQPMYREYLLRMFNTFWRVAALCAAFVLHGCDNGGAALYDCGNITVTTLAGSGEQGSGDGAATSATFDGPFGVATDGTNLYVADQNNNKIRKVVMATGAVTTLAGSGTAGADEGTGIAATFNRPAGVATDGTNLYVADSGNNKIRKIVIATGVVSTLAGSGTAGADEGTGIAATFSGPTGIASDGTNLYVADTGNVKIRKIVIASGVVTTLAGSGAQGAADGAGAAATFWYPYGIATDGANVFVTDAVADTVRKIVIATGDVSTLAGSVGDRGSQDGTGAAATFDTPMGVATDGTNLYVADTYNYKIRKVVIASRAVTTLAGSGAYGVQDGNGRDARFRSPSGIVTAGASPDGINLYVADSSGNNIRKVNYVPGVCASANGYLVGGDVGGLSGTLVLANNGGNNKTITANGVFTFSSSVGSGQGYNVTVLTQPTGQTCTVANGSGTATGRVSNVAVTCVSNGPNTIGGAVTGLSGSLVLQNNGTDNLTRNADGSFTFATPVTSGSAYVVTVLTQPVGQFCTVSNGSGTASGNVSNVAVTCSNNVYSISGIANGLSFPGLVLQNNGGDDLSVFPGMPGPYVPFTFSSSVTHGGPYAVTILSQPAGQTCTVTSGGSGTATSNVTDVVIDCI